MLQWNATDFIECLEVDYFFEPQDAAYEFHITGSNINVEVRVIPDFDLISVKLISKNSGEYYSENTFLVLGSTSYDRNSETIFIDSAIPVDDEFYTGHFRKVDLPDKYRFTVSLKAKPEFSMNIVLK